MSKFFLCGLIALIVLLVLFFPVFLNADFYYQIRSKKVGFHLSLYGKIKLFGGYIATYQGGVAIHLSQKKALLTGYREMEDSRKNFPFQDFFSLKKISLHIRTGADYFFPLYGLQTLKSIVAKIRPKYERLIDSKLCLVNGDELRLSARIITKSTLYKQLKGFIKYMIRRILSTWKMKKSTT